MAYRVYNPSGNSYAEYSTKPTNYDGVLVDTSTYTGPEFPGANLSNYINNSPSSGLSGKSSGSNSGNKPNLYYTPGDAQAAQRLGSYYNLVPYTSGTTIGPNDFAIGGSAVIPNSALINPNSRIAAGYDAAETAQQVNNYINKMNAPSSFNDSNSLPSFLQTPQYDFDALIKQLTDNLQKQISSLQAQIPQTQPTQNPINIANMYKKGTTLNQLNPYANTQFRNGYNGARIVDNGKQRAVSRYMANDIWKDKISGGGVSG